MFMEKMIYGLLGEKLGHSFSPAIHKLIFEKLKTDSNYELFEVERDDLDKFIIDSKNKKIKGMNVTIPYKIEVMKYLDEISLEASKISAVNTILFENGKLKGYNTDYYGFDMLLKKNKIELKGKSVVVLGSGGAAKAVNQNLLDNEVKEVYVVSRDKSNPKNLFEGCKLISYEELNNLEKADIIINTTPIGMYPNTDEAPLPLEIFNKFSVAVDLIYNPKETLFLQYAKKHNIKSVNGLYMLVGQAIKSQEIWNGISIDDQITDEIFIKVEELI